MTETFDVIVVGGGYAGGVAAIEAHDAGVRVLLLEKRNEPGGISVSPAGGVRYRPMRSAALAYLEATNRGTTPAYRARSAGERHDHDAGLYRALGRPASATVSAAPGTLPTFPVMRLRLRQCRRRSGLRRARRISAVRGSPAAARLFKVVRRRCAAGASKRCGCAAETMIVENGASPACAPAARDRAPARSCSRPAALKRARHPA